MVAPISGRSWPRSGAGALAIPAIAPAALARIRAEIWLMPGDVDDRVHHRHVDVADVRPRVAGGDSVETISLGTPTGSARIAAAAIEAVPRAAEPDRRRRSRPSPCSRDSDRGGALGPSPSSPRRDRRRAASSACSTPAAAGHLLAGDVGLGTWARRARRRRSEHRRRPAASIAIAQDRRTRAPWCRACRAARRVAHQASCCVSRAPRRGSGAAPRDRRRAPRRSSR